MAATTTASTTKRTTRMTRRMAGIAPTTGARGITAATATAGVMHELRNDDGLGDNVAAVLAFVGFLLFAAFGIGGRTDRLRIDEFQGVDAAFRASRELVVLPSVFLHHNDMTVGTAVRRELQGLCPIFGKMVLWQAKQAVFPHHIATVGTAAFVALFHLFLQDAVIYPAYPRRHPHRHLIGGVVVRCFVNRLWADGGL